MATITAQMVKELRDKTDAGMMDCKRALSAADGDMEKAVENLRKAGIAKAAKKAGRTATEGLVVSSVGDTAATLVEVLCETDFVARNDKFQSYAQELATRVANTFDKDGDLSAQVAEAEKEAIGDLVAVIGENIQVRRAVRWESSARFASYMHMGGKIGVLIEAEGEADTELLNDICMHIAAFNPQYISPDQVPEDVFEKEKEIAQAQVEGKPENILAKIVEGKVRKWQTEVCLTKQPWLRDDKTTLEKVAPNVTIKRFLRWAVGEDL